MPINLPHQTFHACTVLACRSNYPPTFAAQPCWDYSPALQLDCNKRSVGAFTLREIRYKCWNCRHISLSYMHSHELYSNESDYLQLLYPFICKMFGLANSKEKKRKSRCSMPLRWCISWPKSLTNKVLISHGRCFLLCPDSQSSNTEMQLPSVKAISSLYYFYSFF